mmetsp:Transcript_20978/g.58587  ORF Transcript_20978/g.58587 Transcript_20978/m.58587 type:complete len:210 (-) Transcript_20978:53-682(-)
MLSGGPTERTTGADTRTQALGRSAEASSTSGARSAGNNGGYVGGGGISGGNATACSFCDEVGPTGVPGIGSKGVPPKKHLRRGFGRRMLLRRLASATPSAIDGLSTGPELLVHGASSPMPQAETDEHVDSASDMPEPGSVVSSSPEPTPPTSPVFAAAGSFALAGRVPTIVCALAGSSRSAAALFAARASGNPSLRMASPASGQTIVDI